MTAWVFVTGAAGFIGGRTVRSLRERGDEVVAIVRDPTGATALRDLGVRLIAGNLGSQDEIQEAIGGSDAVIHIAGSYRVGIPRSERPAMYEANVTVTDRVLDAAIAAGIPRIVQVSTISVFGDTRGRVVDETYRRDLTRGFLSYYDETKYLAHVATEARMQTGAPIVIVQPGTAYGPGDHSGVGEQLKAAFDGTARYIGLGDLGISPVHVDDVAGGIVAALDRGRIGEAYALGGENIRVGEAMAISARAGGRRPPRLHVPTILLRMAAPFGEAAANLVGLPPNLAEVLKAADGVTYWTSHAKATAELGYAPRDLATGAVDAFARP